MMRALPRNVGLLVSAWVLAAMPAHPVRGEIMTTGLGVKLSETPGYVTRPPLVGEHTTEVLAARGFSEVELARLREARAIG